MRKSGKFIGCNYCAKIIYRRYSSLNYKNIFCSVKCKILFQTGKPQLKIRGKKNPMFGVHHYGEEAPMYGKHHSKKTRLKMSLFRKGKRHVNWSNYKGGNKEIKCPNCKKIRLYRAGGTILKTKYCIICYRKLFCSGENNPQWQGGKSFEPYSPIFNQQLKDRIRKRDNYTCQICNMTEEEHIIVFGEVIAIHHIDYNKKNCNEENLISLCKQCNGRVNFNRDYWKEHFSKNYVNLTAA